MAATLVTLVMVLGAVLAPGSRRTIRSISRQLNLLDSHLPPVWRQGGDPRFLLGTDDQGRDVLSTILYGSRIVARRRHLVGRACRHAWHRARADRRLCRRLRSTRSIMRAADVQLTFPAILIALLIDGTVRALFGEHRDESAAFWVLVLSIGLSFWVQYARTVRGSTLVERNKDYVLAARLIGIHPGQILVRHILPNVIGPVLVIVTINLALAIILEATLSFLGVGLSPTQPSLGTHDPDRQQFPVRGRMVDRHLSRDHAGAARALGQSAR